MTPLTIANRVRALLKLTAEKLLILTGSLRGVLEAGGEGAFCYFF